MMIRSLRAIALPAALACLAVLPIRATALEYSVDADYQGEYTSNARRRADEKTSDFVHQPGVTAQMAHAGAQTSLDLRYRLSRRYFEDKTFDHETLAEGYVLGQWDALPDRLSFFASNNRREAKISARGQAVPDNLQEASWTSLGSTLQADLVANHFLTLGYTFTTIGTEVADADSDRHTGQLTYGIPLSPISTLTLSGTVSKVDFDSPLAPDYDATTGSVGYAREFARGSASIAVGYTTIDRELNRDTREGYVGSFQLSREVGAASSISFSFSQSLTDNSLDAWQSTPRFSDQVIVGDTDTTEVYQQRTAALTYATTFGLNTFSVSVAGSQEDYDDPMVGRDVERSGVTAALSRQIRPTLDGTVTTFYQRYEFTDATPPAIGPAIGPDGTDDDYGAGLHVSWSPTPRLNAGAGVFYFRREGPEPIGGGSADAVEDWRAQVTLSFLLFGNRFGSGN